jgi:hypothetical protein
MEVKTKSTRVSRYFRYSALVVADTNSVFGRGEIRKRERGEREVGKREAIFHVWFRRETKKRDKIRWDPCIFCFSPLVRRN